MCYIHVAALQKQWQLEDNVSALAAAASNHYSTLRHGSKVGSPPIIISVFAAPPSQDSLIHYIYFTNPYDSLEHHP